MATMGNSPKRSEFRIFRTDYENYDIMYSCEDSWLGYKTENFSVSTREKVWSDELKETIRQVVEEEIPQYSDFDSWVTFHNTDQGDESCEYEWKFEDRYTNN